MGNWLYKEWSQIDQYDEFVSNNSSAANKQQIKNKLKRRSLINFAADGSAEPLIVGEGGQQTRRNSIQWTI